MLTSLVGDAHAPAGPAIAADRIPQSAELSANYPIVMGGGAAHPGSAPLVAGVTPACETTTSDETPLGARRWASEAEEQAFVDGAAAGASGKGEADNPYLVETPSGWAWLSGLRWVGSSAE